MSLEQSQGIQALLAAEKASTETINKARKKKQMRLKQAQEEAEAEVQRYKQEREQQFQSWSAQ
ncbi:V-type ATPase, G subunit, partial [Sphaeroforma arctica JP610]